MSDVEIIQKIAENAKQTDTRPLISKITLILCIIGVTLLIFLTFTAVTSSAASKDLSDVLNRRSPIISHLSCYEDRLTAFIQLSADAQRASRDGKGDPIPLTSEKYQLLEKKLEKVTKDLTDANDKKSPNKCPGIPEISKK